MLKVQDLLSQMLSLRHKFQWSLFPSRMVELNGIEPLTPCLQSRCSPS